jgi:hypothetical protein
MVSLQRHPLKYDNKKSQKLLQKKNFFLLDIVLMYVEIVSHLVERIYNKWMDVFAFTLSSLSIS